MNYIKSNKNYYKLYGLTIESNIELEELIAIEPSKDTDVKIKLGKLPSNIKEKINCKSGIEIKPDYAWFRVENVGIFFIENNSNIIIEPDEDVSLDKLKLFIYGSTMGIVLILKNRIAIHGSSVLIGNKIYIITGDMGAGKSTLTTALREKGHGIMADDVSALNFSSDGSIYVEHGYPMQKLCEDALDKFSYNKEECNKVENERNKYSVPIENFIVENTKLGGIIKIEVSDHNEVEMNELRGSEKLTLILDNIYRKEAFRILKIPSEYMKKCIIVGNLIPIYSLKRPKGKFTVDEQIQKIYEYIK